MTLFESCLPAKGWLHGRKEPSLADIAVYSIITFPEHGLNQHNDFKGLDSTPFPKCLAVSNAVGALIKKAH